MSKKYMESGVNLEAGYESVERIKRILDQFQKSQHIAFDDYGGNTTMVSFSADDKDYQSGSDSFDKDDEPQNKK